MPELPEVETIKKDLQGLITGRKIVDITTDSPKQVKPSLEAVKKAAVGAKVTNVNRQAKVLVVELNNGVTLAIHLKLTGRLLFRDAKDEEDKWVHVLIKFDKGKELRFSDSRKFGWVRLVNSEEWKVMSRQFGPEPGKDLDLEAFKKMLASTSRAVKVAIMDQKKIAGVGNIYACDALFLAKIDPRRPANKLHAKEAERLYEAILQVLKAGIKYRGASDQYYLDALGREGHYQEHFLVYGRTGKECFGCKGKVERIVVAGRGTFWCPVCQK